ncbi:sensor histidine kinase inhibitor, KipI family [Anaerovibrio lipolyticus DSM 3074]|uniref:Sensor histidine kinase inhibitor, KipI family n=1 Tax=Anaerovibrio lipolyticus DSM 3074 TaxID=1120997 RepID=A0A1M6DB00_9FIRM|nr:5-oxoprolinase subunit PxpB [Anaerovibrio lipolyticus]SHI70414.1 sensor histidine kinase inhibitor, KipI family [Anaerovibrio lipolyticus DSM 3074]
MEAMRILTVGDCAVSVEFGQEISLEINHKVMALKMVLEREPIRGIVELIPTYCSLLIQYDPMDLRYGQLRERLEALVTQLDEVEMPPKQVVEIPVAYGGEYGPDLVEVARAHNISEEEVIKLHSEPEYPIYMLGFVAGFPYLGGMNKAIATPRKQSPRLKIEAGSVGIAGEQTGIYSVESPGGWQIIGRTPLKLYDVNRNEPVLLKAGQYIKFKPITKEEFRAMENEHKGN